MKIPEILYFKNSCCFLTKTSEIVKHTNFENAWSEFRKEEENTPFNLYKDYKPLKLDD